MKNLRILAVPAALATTSSDHGALVLNDALNGSTTGTRSGGAAQVEVTRPKHFPHRIWAACDFEGRTPDYAWFGPPETNNILLTLGTH